MKRTLEKVVFFGSGPLAAKALQLLNQDFAIEAVITKPKPEHHKGDWPVLAVCQKLKLPHYTVKDQAHLTALFKSRSFKSRLGIVIDFGLIIPKDVIDSFKLGVVNSHFSLLPQWRGPDPISAAILSGQKETGVSLMLINEKLDEGQLLGQVIYTIGEDETGAELSNALLYESHFLLVNTLPKYLAGQLKPYSQFDHILKPTYSRKLTKADGVVDWSKPAEQIEREIRAFIEWPKSQAKVGGQEVIITKAKAVKTSGQVGHLKIDGHKLFVYCGQGGLQIERLKPSGKQEMSAEGFLAGYRSRLTP